MVSDRTQKIETKTEHSQTVKYRVYEFIANICTPLARQFKALPSNTEVTVSMKRSTDKSALINVVESENTFYANNYVQLNNCYLEVPFLYGDKLYKELSYSARDIIEYPLDKLSIKTHTIIEGSKNVTFNLGNGGKVPSIVIAGLIPADNYHGDFSKSPTVFARNGLIKYDNQIDNKVLPYFPITCGTNLVINPYVMFLRVAKWFGNSLVGKLLSYHEFEMSNFLIAYDFTGLDVEKGWLSFNLEFAEETSEKLMFIALTVSEETLSIDKDGIVAIN